MKATLTIAGMTDGVYTVCHYDTLAIYRDEMNNIYNTLLMSGAKVKIREYGRNTAMITYRV